MASATQTPSLSIDDSRNSKKKKENYGKIPFSDVVVTHRPNAYWGREWSVPDVLYALIILTPHVLCLFAPFHFTWDALGLALALYVITGLFGVNLSFHRNLSHYSFKLNKWVEYLFAYSGLLALQGTPMEWVSNHRFHHKYTDKEQDPHSPINGFWFSHVNWIINQEFIIQKCGKRKNVEDMRKQWFYRFIQQTHLLHAVGFGFLLYKVGGLPYLTWGMGVRVFVGYHAVFLVNSACHIWGHQAWNTGDLSKNNGLVAMLTFGDGWHNNHHAFEYSARHGLEWWQLDVAWLVIKTLEFLGLATDVKLPSDSHKLKMSFKKEEME